MISSLPSAGSEEWLRELAARPGEFAGLLAQAGSDSAAGFRHTVREIAQQPPTWSATARLLADAAGVVREALEGCERMVLTGSGSSEYAGACAAPEVQAALGLPVEVAGGGELLLRRQASIGSGPALVVSLARSGDSPESAAVIETLLATEPATRHLVITCNRNGRAALEFAGNPRVTAICLSDEVNDHSLVMTSSFTNLALSARFLGAAENAGAFVERAERLNAAGRALLERWPDRLAGFASGDVRRVVFLGGGCRFGAAREGALKVLEMTAGGLATMAETFLGVRHGPMSFIDGHTLVVAFLSSDPLIRAYELDLIEELNAKKLGLRKLIAGTGGVAADLCRGEDVAMRYELADAADGELAVLGAVIAQIIGFHCCRRAGLSPDSPSAAGVISRVVGSFRIHKG